MILVTGGTGLVGSHLLYDLVKSGKKVRAIKRTNSSIESVKKVFSYYSDDFQKLFSAIEWVDADILDIYSITEAMKGIEQVYHCAAIVSFIPREENEMMQINIDGTANVVNAALENKIKKLCYVSSIAAVGRNITKGDINEETFWTSSPDNSAYSISKYGAEREVWRGMEEGLTAVIVNPGVIVGPGNWKKGSSRMFAIAYNGLKYYTNGITGWVDVRDVSMAMIQLMESEIKNERFILSAENATYKKFFDTASEAYGKQKPYIKVSKVLAEIGWRIEKIRSSIKGSSPFITKETARAAHEQFFFSNNKIKSILKMEFFSLEDSIKHGCNLFLIDLKTNK